MTKLLSWLSSWRKRRNGKATVVRSTYRRLFLELLERPELLSTYVWTGAAGDSNWTTAGNWTLTSGSGSYPTAIGDVAQFTGAYTAAQTVNITAAITVGEIDFGATGKGVTVAKGTGGTLTLQNTSGAAVLDYLSANAVANTISIAMANTTGGLNIVNTGSAAQTISGSLKVTSGLTLTNSGTSLDFSGAITTGTTASTSMTATVNGGSLIFNNNAATTTIGPLSTYTINSGGTLSAGANTTLADGQTNFGLGQITLNNGSTLKVNNTTDPMSLANPIVLGNNAAVTLTGAPFLFAGDSITLNGSNTITVNSTALTGTLTPTQTTIKDIVSGLASSNTLTIAGTSTLALDSSTFGLAGGNPITLTGNALSDSSYTSTAPTFTVNVPTTINNVLGGTGQSLNVTGNSTLSLGGANTYTGGTNIQGGTLALGATNALPSSTTIAFGASSTNGTLDLAGFNQTVAGLTVASGAVAASQVIGNSSTSNNATLTINGGSTTFAGIIEDALGSGSQQVALTIAGALTALTLKGANTYTGGTNIQGGTLALGATNALPSSTTIAFGASSTNGTLDLAGFNQTVAGLTVASGAVAASQVIGNSSTSNNATLTINGGSTTFAGIIEDALGSGSQQVALTIAGGALTLGGANTYTGPTTVNGGTLLVDSPGSIASSVTVNANGTLAGTGSLAAVTLAGGTGTANPGDPATSVGTLAATSADLSNGNLTLEVGGYATAGVNYDQFNLGVGALTLSNASTLTLDLSGSTTAGTATSVILYSSLLGQPQFPAANITTINNVNNLVPILTYGNATGTPGVQGVNLQLVNQTTTSVSSSNASVTYGTSVTFTATVSATNSGTAPTAGSVDFFDVTTNTDLGLGTFGGSVGLNSTWTYNTTARQLKVTTGDTIKATYSPGGNFSGSFGTATEVVTPLALTVTAISANKVYDGTTSATATPTITSGSLVAGDTASFTEAYASKNAGTNLTLTPTGAVSDGNGGANYSVTFVNNTTGIITPLALTVTAVTNSKVYDGTTSATTTPSITSGSLATGDTANFTETYTSQNVGTNLTLTPSGAVTDNNGGANYTVTFVTNTTGVITARAITVTAATNSKGYDGTTTATATPTISSGSLATGDTATFTETYTSTNVGTSLTLTPTGSVNDNNGGANYSVTFVNSTTGIITPLALTVTAVTNSKTYDGTTSATVTPTITSGTVVTGDTANFTEVYASKNAGTNLTLTPTGAVSDGNGGANYSVTFVNNTTGIITPLALTVTAVTNSKVYDGTTSATTTPSITSGSLATGDTANFTETYTSQNVGTNLTLTPSGAVTDNNGGANYTVTFVTNTTGVITARAITVTAATNSKGYDGTTTATATPTITSGSLVTGDTATFTETYSNKNAGTNLTLTPTGSVNDGNSGANYSVTFVHNTTGVITARALTVTALTNTKTADGTTSAAAIPTITSGSLATGDTANFFETYNTAAAGTGKTLTPTGSVVDGNSGNNYAVTFATNTTGVINVGAVEGFLVSAPSTATTGVSFSITVTALDGYGNTVTGYNGTVHFSSNAASASLPPNSTLTNGTATFTSVVLNSTGNDSITATDTLATFPTLTGTSNTIVTRGAVVTSFTPTATGFTVTFSKPINVSALTLYGTGNNTVQDVTLIGASNGLIRGTLVIAPSDLSATFEATASFLQLLQVNNGYQPIPVLPDDTYFVTLVSGSGSNGFQDMLGAGLDGLNNGGTANYTASFTTAYTANATPVLGMPDFARGPNSAQTIQVPNNAAAGIPITLYNYAGVTSVTFTLSYNPALLAINGTSTADSSDPTGSVFTLLGNDSAHGSASFSFHDSTAQDSTAGPVVLGDILADVPNSAGSLYKDKELLQFGNITINGMNSATTGAVSQPAVDLNAYFGDVTGDGLINAADAIQAKNVADGTNTGFAAYTLLDPTVVGDLGDDGSVDASAITLLNRYAAGFRPAQIPVPPSSGVTIVPQGADPTLSLSGQAQVNESGVVDVPVLLDHPDPTGSTGLTEAVLALTYNPAVLSVSAADITLGSVPASGTGWQLSAVVDQATGEIGVVLYSGTAITDPAGGSLVNIAFQVLPGVTLSGTSVQLVGSVTPNGQLFTTQADDAQGRLQLTPAPTNGPDNPSLDRLQVGTGIGWEPATQTAIPESAVNAPAVTENVEGPSPTLPSETAGEAPPVNLSSEAAISAPLQEATIEFSTTETSSASGAASGAIAVLVNVAPMAVSPSLGLVFQLQSAALVNALVEGYNPQQPLADKVFLALARGAEEANQLGMVSGATTNSRNESPALAEAVASRLWNTSALELDRLGAMEQTVTDGGQFEGLNDPLSGTEVVDPAALDECFAQLAVESDEGSAP